MLRSVPFHSVHFHHSTSYVNLLAIWMNHVQAGFSYAVYVANKSSHVVLWTLLASCCSLMLVLWSVMCESAVWNLRRQSAKRKDDLGNPREYSEKEGEMGAWKCVFCSSNRSYCNKEPGLISMHDTKLGFS